MGLAALCLIAIAGWYFRAHPPPAALHPPSPQVATIRQKTIAVLPFENLSPEKEDAFFAAGIQDDLLTTLGKIKELKVIGRTSVMTYRQARASEKLREIGQTLARARLSIAISSLTQGEDLSRKAKAQTEAEEALHRRPDLGEGRLAVAYCYFYWDKDYDRALLELSRAAELMPSSSEVPLTAAFIYKSQTSFARGSPR